MFIELTVQEWEAFLSQYPDAHLLQSASWGELKAVYGWQVVRVVNGGTFDTGFGMQVLFRKLPFLNRTIAYIAKGPVGNSENPYGVFNQKQFWSELDQFCKLKGAIFLKIEPDLWEQPKFVSGEEPPTKPIANIYKYHSQSHAAPPGFTPAGGNIQPRRTILVNIRGDDERILGRMKQKTRYNIRLALKKNVIIKTSTDLSLFYRLIKTTSERDRFPVHDLSYYQLAYELFHPRGMCELFVAEYESEPLATLMSFAKGQRAWYLYGGSSSQHRELMPTYLLQWEAMRWARSLGCVEYDLWGVPDEDLDVLEDRFTLRSDGLWGVYRFKRGFGGRLYRAAGAWDRIYYPLLYFIYRVWIRSGGLLG